MLLYIYIMSHYNQKQNLTMKILIVVVRSLEKSCTTQHARASRFIHVISKAEIYSEYRKLSQV